MGDRGVRRAAPTGWGGMGEGSQLGLVPAEPACASVLGVLHPPSNYGVDGSCLGQVAYLQWQYPLRGGQVCPSSEDPPPGAAGVSPAIACVSPGGVAPVTVVEELKPTYHPGLPWPRGKLLV